MLLGASCMSAQTYVKQGTTITQVVKQKAKDIKTEYTYKDSKGNEYPIYLSVNGRAYYVRISAQGKEYKSYLGEEISRQICKELGNTRTSKSKELWQKVK